LKDTCLDHITKKMDVPVVQGTAVPGEEPKYTSPNEDYSGDEFAPISAQGGRPDQQPSAYRDVIWAVAFYAHLVAMITIISLNMQNGGFEEGGAYSGILKLVGILSLSTITLGSATLQFMMKFPTELVKASLIMTVALSGAIAVLGLLSGQVFAGVLGIIFFAIGVCYARAVWPRIPFAAANLNTALTAVKSNMGLTVIGYGMILVAFG
jgi:hypothetical protein